MSLTKALTHSHIASPILQTVNNSSLSELNSCSVNSTLAQATEHKKGLKAIAISMTDDELLACVRAMANPTTGVKVRANIVHSDEVRLVDWLEKE